MIPMAVPSANSADTMGKMAAKKEPKTINSTTRARSTPSPLLLNDWLLANSASWPVAATVRPEPEVCTAAFTKSFASEPEMFWASLSKVTGKNPTVRSGLMFAVSTRLPAAS